MNCFSINLRKWRITSWRVRAARITWPKGLFWINRLTLPWVKSNGIRSGISQKSMCRWIRWWARKTQRVRWQSEDQMPLNLPKVIWLDLQMGWFTRILNFTIWIYQLDKSSFKSINLLQMRIIEMMCPLTFISPPCPTHRKYHANSSRNLWTNRTFQSRKVLQH